MNRFKSAALATAAAAFCAAASAAEPEFPRLAGVNIGGPHSYEDPAYQTQIARLDAVIINYWPGWERNRGTTLDQVVKNIKAKNPNIRVFVYVVNNELENGSDDAWQELRNKLDANQWWLYQSGGSGTRVKSTFGTTDYIINNTEFAKPDSSGMRFIPWFANWIVDKIYKPNPSIDGFFMDNVFWKPRVDGDWNRDGTTDSMNGASAGTWLRKGYREHFATMNSLMPGKLQIANVADWGHKDAILTELNGVAHGGVLEGMIGVSYAPEQWDSWAAMMSWYRKTMAALADPKIAFFNQHGSPTDWQGFRYGFASCLLDDGYYSFTNSSQEYYGVDWFDEYDVKLGRAVSAPPTSPWKQGVYRREFEKGIVLVNPRGNGAETIDLEGEYRRIAGTQDRTVNSGQLTHTVTLKDRDGIVLLKTVRRPKAPGGVRIGG